MQTRPLIGKRCVITGATSGIGLAAARALAGLGAEVTIVGHDLARGVEALASVAEAAGTAGAPTPKIELADLSQMREVDALAERIAAASLSLDILINCAGYYSAQRVATDEGLEMQFAVNYLAPYRLTLDLLPVLARDSRIFIVSSNSHYYGWIRWHDPLFSRHYLGLWAYEQSKLADVLFGYELDRRLADGRLHAGPSAAGTLDAQTRSRPAVYLIDPGLVNTDMGQKHGHGISSLFWSLHRRRGTSPEQPAHGIATLASAPADEAPSGLYWRDAKAKASSLLSRRKADGARLWDLSTKLIEAALKSSR